MIRSVAGVVPPDAVAQVLPHEHVLHRIHPAVANSTTAVSSTSSASPRGYALPIRNEDLQQYRVSPGGLGGQNLVLEKEDEAFRELELLEALPGRDRDSSVSGSITTGATVKWPLVVDVTLPIEGRDALMTQRVRLAEKLKVHLVSVTTCDFERASATFPLGLPVRDQAERLAKALETDLMFGFSAYESSSSAVGAGTIYQQIHTTSYILGEHEAITAHAIALAQQRTHAPVYLSFSFSANSVGDTNDYQQQQFIRAWVQELLLHGAESSKIVVCHADQWCADDNTDASTNNYTFLQSLLKFGVRLLFTMIGLSTVSDTILMNPCLAGLPSPPYSTTNKEPPRDSRIAKCISRLIQEQDGNTSNIHQLLLSTNVQQRIQYLRYGGGGYTYLFTHFKQRLLSHHGVSEQQFQQLVHDNAVGLLSWYIPPEAPEVSKDYLKCSICKKDFEPIIGEYFTKFEFIYCGTKCLRKHSRQGFAKLSD